MRSNTKNRLTAGLALGVCLILAALAASFQVPASADFRQRASSFFTDETGTRAAYLVLQETLPSVDLQRQPLESLGDPAEGASTLIVTDPKLNLSPREAGGLDRWLQAGGQLILAASDRWRIRSHGKRSSAEGEPEGEPEDEPAGKEEKDDKTGPDFLGRHGLTSGAATKSVGMGRIVVIPDNKAFSNVTLRADPEAAVRLVNLCASWGNGRALIDEYHQGFGEKRGLAVVIGLFLKTPWGLTILQLAAAGAIYTFGLRRRFGRVIDEVPPNRSSPLDIVNARGGLFHAASSRMFAARAIHRHLNGQIAASTGRHGDLLDEPLRRRLSGGDSELESDMAAYAKLVGGVLESERVTDAELIQIGKFAGQIQGRLHDAGGGRGHTLRTAG